MLRLIPLLAGLALVLYPAAVYLGLSRWGAQPLAFILMGVAILRWLASRRLGQPIGNGAWLVLAAVAIAAFTLGTGSAMGLKIYPIIVNAFMLILFAHSLWQPQSMIERFARLREPELPPEGVAYTRKVTAVWCGFFAINGAIATATIFASDEVWALYNGLIAYLLMGALLGGEVLIRARKRQGDSSSTAALLTDD